ncbi:MAG: DoxX family protein [Planctomycetaceae bacterium]|nr:DoxX family protein [Planctomycetaceae bacterium]
MIMLLRVTIGWHFLYAGLDKLTNPDFTSAGFLGQSKGPFAQHFYDLVPDIDGIERLTAETHTAAIDQYANRFIVHYRPSQEQRTAITEVVTKHKKAVGDYLDDNKSDLDIYRLDLEKLKAGQAAPDHEMPFQQKRLWDKQTELRGKSRGWLAQLKAIDQGFQAEMLDKLTEAQRRRGPVPETPEQRFSVDRIVTYTNIAIGACLIAGLFTRLAALGGALFLLQIVLAQPAIPGLYPPPHPSAGNAWIVNKEFIEMMALFALATMQSGQWGGLDFLIRHLLIRPVYRQEGT